MAAHQQDHISMLMVLLMEHQKILKEKDTQEISEMLLQMQMEKQI